MYTVFLPVGRTTEGTTEAVEAIASLPAGADVRVIVAHVTRDIELYGPDGSYVSLDRADLRVPDPVESVFEQLAARGIDVSLELRQGEDVADTLLEAARDHEADLIVVPTRRRSKISEVLFGSTTTELLRSATVPVTVVSATE